MKPIKSRTDHQEALGHIETLIAMDPEPGTKDADLLQVLAILVEEYEKRAFPLERPDPMEAIRFRMGEQGLRQADLVAYIGSRSKVSEVLNRKRPLSLTMIRALSEGLGIPVEILIAGPRGNPSAAG